MKRLLPAPLVSVGLALAWLLLNPDGGRGQLLLALLLAIGLPLLLQGLRPQRVRVRHPLTVLRLCLRVMLDTTRSNIAVLRYLLQPARRPHPSGFVHIPLQVRDPNALAVLAMIVCITPGTVWAELSLDRSLLMLHVLEVADAQAVAAHVQRCYEAPLMEIFES
ncbi:Na+/H+ antiporter subunit E [Comamonas sp. NLF-1-9]|uniref:Na+/H+ antiporter subunit E n=1 Tax=Comamonas sp. NLF-1-9 TaxID=2853163 RepID=UPI001C492124|nr:Na+/H+ antiporter subunit E [Comamonas sp. NLF-1-9]QXL85060.1 Na+/H+ antiporter subunit E [Comamonas sp. NLF-1-9]